MNISHAVQGDEMNISNQFLTRRSLLKINGMSVLCFNKANHLLYIAQI